MPSMKRSYRRAFHDKPQRVTSDMLRKRIDARLAQLGEDLAGRVAKEIEQGYEMYYLAMRK